MESKKLIFIIGLCFSSTAFSSTNTGNNNAMPEETLPSYQAAATSGADYLELDLHMTKDCQIIARHNPWMKDNTNVAEVAKKTR